MGLQKPSMQLLADREQHYIHDAFGHARDCEGNRTKVELCEMSSACYYWHRQSSFKTNASRKVFLIIPSFYEIGGYRCIQKSAAWVRQAVGADIYSTISLITIERQGVHVASRSFCSLGDEIAIIGLANSDSLLLLYKTLQERRIV